MIILAIEFESCPFFSKLAQIVDSDGMEHGVHIKVFSKQFDS
jgi:hypothetical protein